MASDALYSSGADLARMGIELQVCGKLCLCQDNAITQEVSSGSSTVDEKIPGSDFSPKTSVSLTNFYSADNCTRICHPGLVECSHKSQVYQLDSAF